MEGLEIEDVWGFFFFFFFLQEREQKQQPPQKTLYARVNVRALEQVCVWCVGARTPPCLSVVG